MEIIFGDGENTKTVIGTDSSHVKIVPETTDRIILILGINRVMIEKKDGWVITRSNNVEINTIHPSEPITLMSDNENVSDWSSVDRK